MRVTARGSGLNQSGERRNHEPREHPTAHRQHAKCDMLPGMQSLALRVVEKVVNSGLIVINGSTLWRLAPKHHNSEFCRGAPLFERFVVSVKTPRTPGAKHRMTVPTSASASAQRRPSIMPMP